LLQFVVTLPAGGGVRLLSQCLDLSCRSAFVGASHVLATGMEPVTVCENESFDPALGDASETS